MIPTDAVNRESLVHEISNRLEEAFGCSFGIWLFDGDAYYHVDNFAHLPIDIDDVGVGVSIRKVSQGCYELRFPFSFRDRKVLAVANVVTGEPELLRRLAVGFLREIESLNQNERLRLQGESYSLQITRDFEELAFLRRLADCIRFSEGIENFEQVAETLIPHVIPSIDAQQVLLVFDDRTDVSDKAIDSCRHVSVGKKVVEESAISFLIDRFWKEALSQPVVRNGLNLVEFPNVDELIVVSIANQNHRIGWLVAINRDLQFLAKRADDPEDSQMEFGTEEAALLHSTATVLATYSANLDLLRQKEKLLVNVVRALVSAVEAKDEYTSGHSERVALFAKRLAEEIGMDDEECQRIYLAGVLHDIGKIGVPDHALKKAGKLTDEEFSLVKRHPEAGLHILGGLESLEYVLPGVLYHHERYDGTGYPCQLAGDQIPIEARILAVVDAFDAMTSNRPYRTGMADEKAFDILLGGRDTHWDGRLVDLFLVIREDILAIRDTYEKESTAAEPKTQNLKLPRKRFPKRNGFTLVELVSVLLIMGIVATLTTARFAKSLQIQKARQAAHRIKADCEMARFQAVATSSPRTISFDVARNQYIIPQERSLDHPDEIYRVRLSEFGVELQTAKFSSDEDSELTFNGYGIPDHGGVIVVNSGRDNQQVDIEAETGLVTIRQPLVESEKVP